MNFSEQDEFGLYKNAPNYTETRERLLYHIKEAKRLRKEETLAGILFCGLTIGWIFYMLLIIMNHF